MCENYFMFWDSVSRLFILLFIIGELNIWFMFGRRFEFVFSIDFIKFLKSWEYCGGMFGYAPRTIFNARNCRLLAVKGGLNAHI